MLCALVNGTLVKAEEKETLESYVEEELQGYLAGFGHHNSKKLEISQGYEVAGSEEEEYAYFIFDNEEMVGEIVVSEVDGKYISSFQYGQIDEIQEAYDNPEEKIALAKTEEDTVVYSAETEEAVSIAGEHAGKRINLAKNDIDIIKKNSKEYLVVDTDNVREERESISLDDIADKKMVEELIKKGRASDYNTIPYYEITTACKLRARNFIKERASDSKTSAYYFIPVGFVKNATVNDEGICWAAAGASIIKHYIYRPELSAMRVFNALRNNFTGTPRGNKKWESNMWEHYGVDMDYNDHKFSYTEVKNALKHNRPIYCIFSYWYTWDGDLENPRTHAVVLCGTYKYNSKLYYVYMDPNTASEEKYVVNAVVNGTADTKTGYEFYYHGGSSYNNWVRAYW